jgi:GTP cyclohydrolase I
MDLARIEEGVKLSLEGVGADLSREGLLDTPARVARMYEEICAGMDTDCATLFEVTFNEGHQEMVLVKDIPLYSICEHHLAPFFGVAHIAYIPNAKGTVCGLSKLARVVDLYAKRLQLQERLTTQIAECIIENLDPLGVMVVVEAEHLCMSMRGIKKPGTITVTSAVRGSFAANSKTRAEALSIINRTC